MPYPLLTAEESKLLVAPDIDAVKKFIASAFQKKENNEQFNYRHIVNQIRSRDGDCTSLCL